MPTIARPSRASDSTTPKKRVRKIRTSAGKVLPIYRFKDGAAKALGAQLPAGAKIVVVPSSPTAAAKLKKAGFVRLVMRNGRGLAIEPADEAKSGYGSAFQPDARARALLRGVRIAQQDLRDAGGAYELDEVRELLGGVSPQAISKRVREGALLAVPGPSNQRRYPTIQFQADGSVLPGLREVHKALPTHNAWAVLNFLVNPDSRLQARRPIDLLKAGQLERVVEAARSLGIQGA